MKKENEYSRFRQWTKKYSLLYFPIIYMILIALNTFKEIIRNRFLTLIFFFGILFTLFSLVLSNLAIGEENKMILDF